MDTGGRRTISFAANRRDAGLYPQGRRLHTAAGYQALIPSVTCLLSIRTSTSSHEAGSTMTTGLQQNIAQESR